MSPRVGSGSARWNVILTHAALAGVTVEITCDGPHVHAFDSRDAIGDSVTGELVAFGSKGGRDHVARMQRAGWAVQS